MYVHRNFHRVLRNFIYSESESVRPYFIYFDCLSSGRDFLQFRRIVLPSESANHTCRERKDKKAVVAELQTSDR